MSTLSFFKNTKIKKVKNTQKKSKMRKNLPIFSLFLTVFALKKRKKTIRDKKCQKTAFFSFFKSSKIK